jgi:hypothetical protein
MTHKTNIVALYRAIAGLPVERQREACAVAAKSLGATVAIEYSADDEDDALREWRRGLKSTDVAMVANLLCIPDWRAPKARPSAVLGEVLTDLQTRGIMLVSALDELSSQDRAKWVALVRAAHDALARGGRKLPRKRAQAMARKSHEKRQPGVARRWLSAPMTKVRERWAAVWRDPVYANAAAALAAMPDDVKSDIRSVETAYRIFGRRAPGDKHAGGRGLKLNRRKK